MNLSERLSEDKLAIFLFHGVVDGSNYAVRNYTNKHIDRELFRQMICDLKEKGRAVSMDEVVEYWQAGERPPGRSFAITFDDGFENNYSVAAPILKDLEVPATFYVTTDFIENNSMSWIDRIECCLEQTDKGRLTFIWDPGEYEFRTRQDKIRILDRIRQRVKSDRSMDPDIVAGDVFARCGMDEIKSSNDPLDLKMSWQEVRELSEHENFTVGGHSHTHKILSYLDADRLDFEVRTSIKLLKDKAGVEPRHYSYPEGLEHCFSDDVAAFLKEFGVKCCPTAVDGVNDVKDSLFKLKRITVV
ncbi:MAG TPA: polysaccharide deacetylase family protein [Planctomycetes bacterium]|nr:polysaccharide deacetylase family protein [Planctomycetota bacterium]HIJ70274.1 polysaccharide deacetylase family protein [Planctomycetota bacterium]